MPLIPFDPRSVSGYPLRARIGQGGMGTVYLSSTPGGRPLALKVVRPEFAADPEFRSRFAKEVAIAKRVQGPFTVPVIDCDADAAQPWIATAYVAAPSLAVAVARQGALPPETVLRLTAGVAEALQSIHNAGVIHRDLKPGNVILAADGPRVIDFGVARAVEAATAVTSQTGMRIGTPAFMAPEQVQGKPLDSAGDVFSLGSTAYYAVTGRPPFGTDQAVFYRIETQQPDWAGCPDRVRHVLVRCLEKNPAARPTPAEVIELCQLLIPDVGFLAEDGWLPATLAAEITRYRLASLLEPLPFSPSLIPAPRIPSPSVPSPSVPSSELTSSELTSSELTLSELTLSELASSELTLSELASSDTVHAVGAAMAPAPAPAPAPSRARARARAPRTIDRALRDRARWLGGLGTTALIVLVVVLLVSMLVRRSEEEADSAVIAAIAAVAATATASADPGTPAGAGAPWTIVPGVPTTWPTAAPNPTVTGCPGSPSHGYDGDGAAVLVAESPLRTGPDEQCDTVSRIAEGKKVWLSCGVVNGNNHIWWWVRLDGTAMYGWMWDRNLEVSYADDDNDGRTTVYSCDGNYVDR